MYSSRKSLSSSLLKGPGRSIGFSPDPLPLNGIGNWWILRKNSGRTSGDEVSWENFWRSFSSFLGTEVYENGIFLLEGPGCTRRTSSMITSQLLCIYVVQKALFLSRKTAKSKEEMEPTGDHWQWVEHFFVVHPDQEQLQDSEDDSLWLQVECWVKENWCDVDYVDWCGGFLKWWYPTTMGFPTKNDHFEVFWGYHHLRKHPCSEPSNNYEQSFKAFWWPPILQTFEKFQASLPTRHWSISKWESCVN